MSDYRKIAEEALRKSKEGKAKPTLNESVVYPENISERIVDINDEIETIKDNPDGDLDDSTVEREVEEKMDEIKDDPVRWLDDYGMEYQQFVDVRGLKDQLVSESDYGTLASYDGTYDEIRVDNTNYVVFRID